VKIISNFNFTVQNTINTLIPEVPIYSRKGSNWSEVGSKPTINFKIYLHRDYVFFKLKGRFANSSLGN
jgi:hypothetical protein